MCFVNKAPILILGTLRSEDGEGSENVAENVNSRSFNLHRDYSVTNFVKCRQPLLKLNS